MKKSIMSAWIIAHVSIFAYGGELKVSALAVSAEKIGSDWSGPTGLVIDDINALLAEAKEMTDVIESQMKPAGVIGLADFTYNKKQGPIQMVTLRVFVFKTEDQCRQWMKTKYQFEGWEKKYKRIEDKNVVGFDSLEMRKRIVAVGPFWITAGSIAENDDHLKILALLLERIRQQNK